MPKDLKKAKKGTASVFPDGVYDAANGQDRVEAFLTPEVFISRFLWGIPLVSPITKQKLTNEDIKDYINRGANQLELDAQVDVFPVIRRHRLPFDPNLYYQWINLEVPNKPIQKVVRAAICSASYLDTGTENENSKYPSGANIYQLPNDWIEMGNARRGVLNVIPINPAFTAIGTGDAVGATGAAILAFIGQMGWVPSYWTVECVHGFCSEDGKVPQIINEAIGMAAAIKVLSNLYPLFRITSQSLSIDGLGQSNTDQLQQLLQVKIQQLQADYQKIVNRIKAMVSNKMFSSNV
jgi:hypothetical protein